LVDEDQFAGSYYSVQRFVRQLRAAQPVPFARMEVEPGTGRRPAGLLFDLVPHAFGRASARHGRTMAAKLST